MHAIAPSDVYMCIYTNQKLVKIFEREYLNKTFNIPIRTKKIINYVVLSDRDVSAWRNKLNMYANIEKTNRICRRVYNL